MAGYRADSLYIRLDGFFVAQFSLAGEFEWTAGALEFAETMAILKTDLHRTKRQFIADSVRSGGEHVLRFPTAEDAQLHLRTVENPSTSTLVEDPAGGFAVIQLDPYFSSDDYLGLKSIERQVKATPGRPDYAFSIWRYNE